MHFHFEHHAKIEPKHALVKSDRKALKPVAPRVVPVQTFQAAIDTCTQGNPASAFPGVSDGSYTIDATIHTAAARQSLEHLYANSWDAPIRAGKCIHATDSRQVKRIKRALHVVAARRDTDAAPIQDGNLQQGSPVATSSSSRGQQQSHGSEVPELEQMQQLQIVSHLWQLHTEHQTKLSVRLQNMGRCAFVPTVALTHSSSSHQCASST